MARFTRKAAAFFAAMRDEPGAGGGFHRMGFTQLVPPAWVATPREGERFPCLDPEEVGAIVFEPDSGYADPVATTEAVVNAFRVRGSDGAAPDLREVGSPAGADAGGEMSLGSRP